MIPRPSSLDHAAAMRLAEVEYDRCVAVLRDLEPADWTRPTECPAWNVRQMSCHMLGEIEMAASVREAARQQRKAARAGGDPVDALTALQVEERCDAIPAEILERFVQRAPKAVAGRRRIPSLVRRRRLPGTQRVNGADEPWTIGYLTDVIFNRDPWMHRMDICRAVGSAAQLTAEHDGAIVADVVAEWTGRHGKDYALILDGPAGGRWAVGANGPTLHHDAVEFCRALSGRPTSIEPGDLFNTSVPF